MHAGACRPENKKTCQNLPYRAKPYAMTLCICIFSFNRGPYLKNCIASIESCSPASKIVIFDDNSNDPDTLETLQEAGKKHTVIQPGDSSFRRLGGLYGNMQFALDYCKNEKLLCFLQDDTQMVRIVSKEDIEAFDHAFDRHSALGFLHPCFMKGIKLAQGAIYNYDESLGLYFRAATGRSAGRYFSALLITRPARLRHAGWQFANSEPANDRLAQKHFIPMGYLFVPFAMWLPEVPAYSGKKKTFALRMAEKKRRSGYYPFRIKDSKEVNALQSRSPSVLPVAEDFLRCRESEPPKPWAYSPLYGLKWFKMLNKLEVKLTASVKMIPGKGDLSM